MIDRYGQWLSNAKLGACCALALCSTALWYGLYNLSQALGSEIGALPDGNCRDVASWLLMWTTGSVYGVLILFRYSSTRSGLHLLLCALAGALSYWAGVQWSVEWGLGDGWPLRIAIAGVLTAEYIGAVGAGLGGLRYSLRLAVSLAVAGAIGGALIGFSIDFDQDFLEILLFVGGHAAWQLLTCIALYFATAADPRSSAREL